MIRWCELEGDSVENPLDCPHYGGSEGHMCTIDGEYCKLDQLDEREDCSTCEGTGVCPDCGGTGCDDKYGICSYCNGDGICDDCFGVGKREV